MSCYSKVIDMIPWDRRIKLEASGANEMDEGQQHHQGTDAPPSSLSWVDIRAPRR